MQGPSSFAIALLSFYLPKTIFDSLFKSGEWNNQFDRRFFVIFTLSMLTLATSWGPRHLYVLLFTTKTFPHTHAKVIASIRMLSRIVANEFWQFFLIWIVDQVADSLELISMPSKSKQRKLLEISFGIPRIGRCHRMADVWECYRQNGGTALKKWNNKEFHEQSKGLKQIVEQFSKILLRRKVSHLFLGRTTKFQIQRFD